MASPDIALMAHLMRRAGFGATRDEIEELVSRVEMQKVEHERKGELLLGWTRRI